MNSGVGMWFCGTIGTAGSGGWLSVSHLFFLCPAGVCLFHSKLAFSALQKARPELCLLQLHLSLLWCRARIQMSQGRIHWFRSGHVPPLHTWTVAEGQGFIRG